MEYTVHAFSNLKKDHNKQYYGKMRQVGKLNLNYDEVFNGNTVGRRLRAAGFLDPKYTGNITYWIDEKGIEVNMKNSGKPVLFVSPSV